MRLCEIVIEYFVGIGMRESKQLVPRVSCCLSSLPESVLCFSDASLGPSPSRVKVHSNRANPNASNGC